MPSLYRSYLALLFVLFFCSQGFSQMRKLYTDSEPENEVLKSGFYSPSEGYVAFRDWIGFTNDSGRTFTKKYITNTNVNFDTYTVNLTLGFGIEGVTALSKDSIFVYGDYGLVPAILFSSNGGNSFKLVFHSQFDNNYLRTGIKGLAFQKNGPLGFAIDADRILKTRDRGQTWNFGTIMERYYFNHLQIIDDKNAIVTSKDINKTSNSGDTWNIVPMPPPYDRELNAVYFLTPTRGWFNATYDPLYNPAGSTYFTNDGGTSWKLMNNTKAAPFVAAKMHFLNDSVGFALSKDNRVYRTTDSGKVWEKVPRDHSFHYLNNPLNDFFFYGKDQFWAGGAGGLLEINNNPDGPVIPAPLFLIDTVKTHLTNTVKLVNYAKNGYQSYRWLLNGSLISTDYNTTYTHDVNRLIDTIQLVVSNGVYTDTLLKRQFYYPPVIVRSFSPAIAGTDTKVMIYGKNFTNAKHVLFGDRVAARFTILTDTSIQAVVGGGSTGSVFVWNQNGFGSSPGFTYLPPPKINSFSPAVAVSGATITITGTDFNNVTDVIFGATPAASFTVVSPTTITAVLGAGASGFVTVNAIGGTAALQGFTVLPVISSFTPEYGTYGTYMTITGTGLDNVQSVTVGGAAVKSFKIDSPSSILAILANGATGNVTVSKPGGNTSKGTFSYYLPPVITGINPVKGKMGDAITISGSNFNTTPGDNIVYFGTVKATVVSSDGNNLVALVPAGAVYAPVSVTNHNLTAHSEQYFNVSFTGGGAITTQAFSDVQEVIIDDGRLRDGIAGDIDGDGKMDMIIHQNGSITSLRNTGTGQTISFESRLSILGAGGEMALMDMDGDGKLDIITTSTNTDIEGKLEAYRNISTPGDIRFDTKVVIITAGNPGAVCMQDIDGDGKPDLTFGTFGYFQDIYEWGDKTIIHRNISNPGKIAFEPRTELKMSFTAGSGAIRDLNKDGKPELFDSRRIYNNTSQKGTISFAAVLNYSDINYARMVAGDVDGDGSIDIACSDPESSKVAIFRNTSASTLSIAPVVYLDAVDSPSGLLLNDFDGDGKPDFAVTLKNNQLALFKNNSKPGEISFNNKVALSPGTYWNQEALMAADFNNDGKAEVAVAYETPGKIYIYLNKVTAAPSIKQFSPAMGLDGTIVTVYGNNFRNISSVKFGGTEAASYTIVNDTTLTAVVNKGASGELTITNNFGTGTGKAFVYGVPPMITSFSPQAAAAGTTVTISGKNFSNAPIVYFGTVKAVVTAASSTSLQVTVPVTADYKPISVTCNNLTAYSSQPFINTFPGAGEVFNDNILGDSMLLKAHAGLGTVGDLDGDGKLDFVTGKYPKSILISLNTSKVDSISFGGSSLQLPTVNDIYVIQIADIDGDGKQDIVACYTDLHLFSVFLNNSTPGNLSFAPGAEVPMNRSSGTLAFDIKDLDQDGKPEIIAGMGNITVLRNLSNPGTVTFAERIDYPANGSADVKATDIDGDGKPDLVCSGESTGMISVLRNLSEPGDLRFALKVDVQIGGWPKGICTGDIDGDGKTDVAISNWNAVNISLLRNTSTPGNISFAGKKDITLSAASYVAWMSDLDGDGKPELGVQRSLPLDPVSSKVFTLIFKNKSTAGDIQLATPYVMNAGNHTWRSGAADLDGDSKPEVIIYSTRMDETSAATALIYRNRTGEAINVSVCANLDTVITTDRTGAVYQWQVNTGSGFTDLSDNTVYTGTKSATLRLKNIPLSMHLYNYRCKVDGVNSNVYGLMVNAPPVPTATGNYFFCKGDAPMNIGGPQRPEHTYKWAPATSLDNDAVATPLFTPDISINYIRTVTNVKGCITKDTTRVTVPQVPTPVITPGGPATFCKNEGILLTSNVAEGNQWYVDGRGISEAANKTYRANMDGVYTAKVKKDGCWSAISNAVALQGVVPPAYPTITATGSTSFCQGGSVTLVSDLPGEHIWTRDEVVIAGASGTSYVATLPGFYQAERKEGNCKSGGSIIVVVTVTTVPKPVVTRSGNFLQSADTTGNQWYKDGMPIAGATGFKYTALTNGNYTVRVTKKGCTSEPSDVITVTTPAGLQVGPNPVQGRLIIQYPGNTDPLVIELLDMNGRLVTSQAVFIDQYEIDMQPFKKGTYFIRVMNPRTGKKETKIIVKI